MRRLWMRRPLELDGGQGSWSHMPEQKAQNRGISYVRCMSTAASGKSTKSIGGDRERAWRRVEFLPVIGDPMSLLQNVDGPGDVRRLEAGQMGQLAREIREFLVRSVGATGGHLGSNLGVVELTLAIHRVFESPHVPIIFDVGHQAYVHKILTGRRDGFDRLRTKGGLSGYPSRAESVHDLVENSHASTALAYADGMSKAFAASGQRDREIVAVIGDGALTGGLAWEGLNNLGVSDGRVIVILNDNERSYAPSVGGLPHHLGRLVDRDRYADLQVSLGGDPPRTPVTPAPSRGASAGIFGALGLRYVGPVDGHDVAAVEAALRAAREGPWPVVVHCLTHKGHGYLPAEHDQSDHLHSVGVIDLQTGLPAKPPSLTWTDVFADTLVRLGGVRPDLAAVTAAMPGPTGLQPFAERFPDRCHDVGIAEQQAIASAAGMAMGGLHPVVALYATFANRAFDQVLLDVGLHRLPVTMVLDRAGVTGPDGPSHHGMWDLAMLGIVPGMRVAAPRDATTLAEELTEAVDIEGPSAVRFPKAALGEPVPAIRHAGDVDVLHEGPDDRVLLVSIGAMASTVLDAAELLADEGIDAKVVDPRWVLPVSEDLLDLAIGCRLVVTVEDGVRAGGVGSHIAGALRDLGVDVPVRPLGLPTEYLPHGSRSVVLAKHGLDSSGVAAVVRAGMRGHRPRRLRLVPVGTARLAGRGVR